MVFFCEHHSSFHDSRITATVFSYQRILHLNTLIMETLSFWCIWSGDRWHQIGWLAFRASSAKPPRLCSPYKAIWRKIGEILRDTLMHVPFMPVKDEWNKQGSCTAAYGDGTMEFNSTLCVWLHRFGHFHTQTLKRLFDFRAAYWCQRMMSARLIGTSLVFRLLPLSSLQPLSSTFPCHGRFSSKV